MLKTWPRLFFGMALIRLRVPQEAERTPLRIMETDRSLLGESRTSFLSHRECMEEEYEYANEFGKQGRKNPRNIPKFTINHERFSCAIEKNI